MSSSCAAICGVTGNGVLLGTLGVVFCGAVGGVSGTARCTGGGTRGDASGFG